MKTYNRNLIVYIFITTWSYFIFSMEATQVVVLDPSPTYSEDEDDDMVTRYHKEQRASILKAIDWENPNKRVLFQNPEQKLTPLQKVATTPYVDIMEQILRAGADPNYAPPARDEESDDEDVMMLPMLPAYQAITFSSQSVAMFELLLQYGAYRLPTHISSQIQNYATLRKLQRKYQMFDIHNPIAQDIIFHKTLCNMIIMKAVDAYIERSPQLLQDLLLHKNATLSKKTKALFKSESLKEILLVLPQKKRDRDAA